MFPFPHLASNIPANGSAGGHEGRPLSLQQEKAGLTPRDVGANVFAGYSAQLVSVQWTIHIHSTQTKHSETTADRQLKQLATFCSA